MHSGSSQHLANIMKYLSFFTLVLMGVLTTEACNPDGHANHKSDDSHEIEHEDVITKTKPSSIAVQTTHDETTMKPSSEAVHSTEKAIIVLAETMNKTTPVVAEMVTSTLTIVTPMIPDVDSQNTTEKPAGTIHEEVNKTFITTPVEMTTAAAEMVNLAIVTSMTPAVVSLNTTEQPPNIIHEEVNATSVPTPVEMTTVAAHVISTENPDKVTPDMMATTTATLHTETSTHITEDMNINKTTAAIITIPSSMPMIVTSPTVVRRERRQVNGTMKTPTPPNTPVFGGRFPTRVPMPITRNAGQGTTVRPATAGSRTTMKPKPVTKQPARLSTTSRVRTPVTLKPQSVTTGPVPVRG